METRHYYARLIKIHIHLIAFDRIVYREIQLIALTLMTSSKARAPELRMSLESAIEMIKLHSTVCLLEFGRVSSQ